jgi:hypothetical protein
MLGLKSFRSAAITLAGVELAHRIRKGQYLLPLKGQGRAYSLKELWDSALRQAYRPASQDSVAGENESASPGWMERTLSYVKASALSGRHCLVCPIPNDRSARPTGVVQLQARPIAVTERST